MRRTTARLVAGGLVSFFVGLPLVWLGITVSVPLDSVEKGGLLAKGVLRPGGFGLLT